MNEDKLLYIEDANKRKLFYRFSPASFISNFTPLIVILDDEKEGNAPHFEYKMWNVLTPIDNFGFENKGSCWLGEKGDFFVKDLLQALINEIAEEYDCEDDIYLYGKNTGGYGAILHGILCQANAVYAYNAPIKLLEERPQEFYDAILTKKTYKENNLSHFLNPKDTFPIFYLCDSENKISSFVTLCQKYGIKVNLDFFIDYKDDEERLKKVLDMFEYRV